MRIYPPPPRHRRGALAAALLALFVVTVASGFAAPPSQETTASPPKPYEVKFATISRDTATGKVQIELEWVERAGGAVVFAPRLEVEPGGGPASAETTTGERSWRADVSLDKQSRGTLLLTASERGEVVQHDELPLRTGTMVRRVLRSASDWLEPTQEPGDGVTLELHGADLKAVLQTLAKILGKKLSVAESVAGTVTVRLEDVPLRKVLDQLASEHGFAWRVDEDVLLVEKR